MARTKSSRGPSIKGCIKRLSELQINELKDLKTRELENIIKLNSVLDIVSNELCLRERDCQIQLIGQGNDR